MLLDELDAPLDDVVVVDRLYIADYNEANILPQEKTILQRLLKWLNPTKYEGDGSELKKHATSHLQGTSQWLIDSPIFEQWHRGNSHGILWIRGVPGTGKSVLAARLIAHLAFEEVPVLYFFFRYTIQSNHRPEAALRDWIAQILPFSPPLQLALKNLTSGDINVGSVENLTMPELWHLLRLALRSIGKAYCVVDALDEMDHEFMENFLQVLDQLGNIHPNRVKLIITSRPIATIEKVVRNLRLLDIRLGKDKVDPDILKYLHHRLYQMSLTLEIRDIIVHEVLKKSDGLFLYAKFAMDTISRIKSITVEIMQEALDSTPVDLSVMYRNLLQEHMGRTDLPEGLCILVLQLVTHATRPLRLLEIADCIKVTKPQFGEDIGILKNLIRSSCGNLLEVLPDESVRVVHHSLTEYLFGLTRSSPDKDLPLFEPGPMHNLLARTCLSYLRAGCLDTVKFSDQRVDLWHDHLRWVEKEHGLHPFLMYAANSWHIHTNKSSSSGFPQDETNSGILSLLMTPHCPKRLAALNSRANASHGQDFGKAPLRQNITLEAEVLLYAIDLDLTSFVKYFLSHNNGDTAMYPGSRRSDPPLHNAIRKGNLDIVRLLIEKGAKLSCYNSQGDTPLHVALGGTYRNVRVYPAIVEYLLEAGADPWQDQGRNTELDECSGLGLCPPINKAFTIGNETIAKLFLPYIKSQKVAQRALNWVINSSQKSEVIHLILNLGLVDINSRVTDVTPLLRACQAFNPKAISILLEAGADPNTLHDDGRVNRFSSSAVTNGSNVLHVLAIPNQYHNKRDGEISEKQISECFELALAAGADVNQVDSRKKTPLHLAGTPLIAKILLDAGADPLAMDEKGSTPLHVAHNVDVMEVLLTKTDINIRSSKGRTVLLNTFLGDKAHDARDTKPAPGKALKLLDLGADPNIADNNGNTIFHYVASRGRMDSPDGRRFLERLIQSGVDVNLRNNEGQTAIHRLNSDNWSSRTTLTDLKVLLELTDIDINAVDNEGNTYLFHLIDNKQVFMGGTKAVNTLMTTMVKAGARFDVRDRRGWTLLHAAIQHCHGGEEILKLLVEQGVDPKQTDNEGNTIWHVAVPRFSWSTELTELFHDIVALGVDVRKPNNHGRLPLHLFCEHYQDSLRYGRSRSKNQTTLFDYMIQQGQEYINRADNDGVLPVHLASTFSTDLTRMILDAGADVTPVTHDGLNVFHLAARCRQSNTTGLLLEWSRARISTDMLFEAINAKDKRGRDPLYYACASGHYQSVELLMKAGAVIHLDAYEGSALQGCVEFECGSKNKAGRGTSALDAVHFRDAEQPEDDIYARSLSCRHARHEYRIDEILDLVVNSTISASRRHIDYAIAKAANRQHDYTVECLLRARRSLGTEEPLPSSAKVQACLKRRASVLASVETVSAWRKGRSAGDMFSEQIRFMVEQRLYHAIPSYIKEHSPKVETKDLHGVCLELTRCGHTGLLDTLLTPDLVSDFEKCSSSTGDNVLKKTGQDMTPLLFAACESKEPNLPMVQMLVKKGAKLDKFSIPNQATPLHAIVKCGEDHWWKTAQALPFILGQAIDLEVCDSEGCTPLNATLEEKDQPFWNSRATEMLLQAGADPSSVDKNGKSCLARAVGNESLFKLLLRHGANLGPAVLTAAIVAKDTSMLEMMLASGVDPNARKVGQEIRPVKSPDGRNLYQADDPKDETELYPLDFLITSMGYTDRDPVGESMMRLLLEHGADPNSRYPKTTVAHRIIQKRGSRQGRRNCYVDAIVQHPLLDVNLKTAAGTTILQAAYIAGDLKSARALLDRGSDIYGKDNQGRSILHLYLKRRSWEGKVQVPLDFLEHVVTLGPELLHQVDKRGQTVLHCAMLREASEEEIELFVSKGADVCAKDRDGNTPLHLLFKHDWILNADDDEDMVPVLDESKKRMVDRFLSRGADINARNEAGDTPILFYFRNRCWRDWISCEEEVHKTVVEQESILWAQLDQLGVDWTAVNNERQSLLHVVAAMRGEKSSDARQQMFQFLIGKGLNALGENNMHQTALDVAAANEAEDILALFNVE